MKKRWTIEVTQEDISAGVPGKCEKCAVALALRRAVEGKEEVSVGSRYASVGSSLWEMPLRLMDWIARFDNEMPVEPGRFMLTRVGG